MTTISHTINTSVFDLIQTYEKTSDTIWNTDKYSSVSTYDESSNTILFKPFFFVADAVQSDDKIIVFRDPIEIKVYQATNLFVAEAPIFDIKALDETPEEAREYLFEKILFLWDDYAIEDDKNLTKDAIRLKQKVLSIIKEVY